MYIQTKNCLWARNGPLCNIWKVSFNQRKREVLRGLFKAMPQQPLYADTLSCGESFHFCLYLGADIVPCGGSTCDLWPSNLCSLTRYVSPHFVLHAAHDLMSSDQGICTGGSSNSLVTCLPDCVYVPLLEWYIQSCRRNSIFAIFVNSIMQTVSSFTNYFWVNPI